MRISLNDIRTPPPYIISDVFAPPTILYFSMHTTTLAPEKNNPWTAFLQHNFYTPLARVYHHQSTLGTIYARTLVTLEALLGCPSTNSQTTFAFEVRMWFEITSKINIFHSIIHAFVCSVFSQPLLFTFLIVFFANFLLPVTVIVIWLKTHSSGFFQNYDKRLFRKPNKYWFRWSM